MLSHAFSDCSAACRSRLPIRWGWTRATSKRWPSPGSPENASRDARGIWPMRPEPPDRAYSVASIAREKTKGGLRLLLPENCKSRSGRKRRAAAAGGGGIGILDDELRTLDAFRVIDLGAHEVLKAHGIDQERHAVPHHRGVVFRDRFIEREAVLKARATAAGHEDPQLEVGIAFFLDQ